METKKKTTHMKRCAEFKSYYVVWKRHEHISELEVTKEFKSYYVVWKQMWIKYVSTSPISLNRTM